jgi:hypothetical protein
MAGVGGKLTLAAIGWKGGQRLLWLHRIGYVTTALIVAELLLIAFLATRGWLQEREMQAGQIEASGTHEGKLLPNGDPYVQGEAIDLLEKLPGLNALHGDGLLFVAMPSFNRSHFAVAVSMPRPTADQADGVLLRFDWQNNGALVGQRHFRMPAPAYRSLVKKMDKLTDGWPGIPGVCADGTPTAFERVRGQSVTSGIGNCDEHYEQIGRLMWDYLRRFAPGDDLPTRGDWEPS